MRKVKRLIVIIMPMLLTGCYQWPSFVIGDSSGIISYDRNTRRLEVLWEKHLQTGKVTTDSVRVDSYPIIGMDSISKFK